MKLHDGLGHIFSNIPLYRFEISIPYRCYNNTLHLKDINIWHIITTFPYAQV